MLADEGLGKSVTDQFCSLHEPRGGAQCFAKTDVARLHFFTHTTDRKTHTRSQKETTGKEIMVCMSSLFSS